MKIFIPLVLAAGILLTGALGPGGIRADDAKAVALPAGEAAPPPSSDETVLSATALVAMRHIVEARADIHAKNPARAREELNQALSLLDVIEAMDPAYRIRLRIWSAGKRLPFEQNTSIAKDLADLYESVEAVDEQVRRESAREHIGKARKYVESGNKKAAGNELALADEALLGTEIDLPVRYTRARVVEAREFLSKKQPEKADGALKSAEDGIRFLSVADYTNVVRARKSLSRAVSNYGGRRFDAAAADLREAKEYLQKEARAAGSATSAEAAALAKDIESAESRVSRWDEETSREIKSLYLRAKAIAAKAAGAFETRKTKGGS